MYNGNTAAVARPTERPVRMAWPGGCQSFGRAQLVLSTENNYVYCIRFTRREWQTLQRMHKQSCKTFQGS